MSTKAQSLKEAEANYFAMLLLVPDHLLGTELEKIGGIGIDDDKKLSALAKTFQVSLSVMSIRLGIYFKENKL